MKILFATSEALPFAMSGGLADVSGALPKALRRRLVGCRVVMPLYKSVSAELREKMTFIGSITVPVSWRRQYCGIFEARVNGNGAEAVLAAQTQEPDLIILDVMMPEMDGLEACTRIREFSQVPIIMLTAKADDMDKLMGFEQGADDYLTKPFNILELKARVRALLRRSQARGAAKVQLFQIGKISLDPDGRNAYKDGVLVELTAKEFDVIELLMRNANRVYSREALLDTLWAYEYRSDIRTVDVHIRRLREKLEENPADPQYIMTKWGVGYYFRK